MEADCGHIYTRLHAHEKARKLDFSPTRKREKRREKRRKGEVFAVMPIDIECSVSNGLVPNMTSCRDFILCINGKMVRRIPCANGLLFDTTIGMCNYEHVVSCGERPMQGFQKCYVVKVNVTIIVENSITEPKFTLKTSVYAQRQPLYYFLLMAAGKDSRFSFNTTKIDDYGEFVLSFNGLVGSEKIFTVWIPSDRRDTGIKQGIHEFYPEDKEVITYKYYSFSDGLNDENFPYPNVDNIVK
ncbi:hypothetical protein LOTGIDRAFT_238959 [Lottia gigantea]|uniref:Chitin-binding type-2 domain-containing protein n=1 Tax=Lottia gigantea TaxID=225164 RepID=V4A545_LOTGI|nr:hypothetical protein LOTGIDRAFT_238959 [Lottia gigantea]ESO99033.1 hypothetical protein LOTGIDRAFT_238959 [Lottia gigantea]